MSSELALDSVVVDGESIDKVIEPDTADELVSVLRERVASPRHLLITGGGTRLSFGNVGGPFDAVLSLRRLNRIIQYDPDDMTIAVEPGCTIAAIQDALRPSNQSLAMDVAHPDTATIGGSFATGLSGPRRLASGSLKDWVIGIEVAGPTGVIAKAGGMVVKNVTGYDMMHVHYGALGALGVVTRLNLKVFPAPSGSRSLRFQYASVSDAYRGALAVLRSQLEPSSILISREAGETSWQLDLRCDAPQNAIDRLSERVASLVREAGPPMEAERFEAGDVALERFARSIDLTGSDVVIRFPVSASRQLAVVEQRLTDASIGVCADLGSGLVYVRFDASSAGVSLVDDREFAPTVLAAPMELKRGRDVFGHLHEPAADITRRMKESFDPERRFNRGRFVLGL